MLKARGRTRDGRAMLLLGLSRRNCELLLKGRPIRVDGADVGLVGSPVIYLMAAETEQAMRQEIAEFLPPNIPIDAPLPGNPVTYEKQAMKTKDRLAEALAAEGLNQLAALASAGAFDDYESESATPIVDLYRELHQRGYLALAERVKNGEFDGTKEEAETWAKSPDGQATFQEFGASKRRN